MKEGGVDRIPDPMPGGGIDYGQMREMQDRAVKVGQTLSEEAGFQTGFWGGVVDTAGYVGGLLLVIVVIIFVISLAWGKGRDAGELLVGAFEAVKTIVKFIWGAVTGVARFGWQSWFAALVVAAIVAGVMFLSVIFG